jgi:hypothetical protein
VLTITNCEWMVHRLDLDHEVGSYIYYQSDNSIIWISMLLFFCHQSLLISQVLVKTELFPTPLDFALSECVHVESYNGSHLGSRFWSHSARHLRIIHVIAWIDGLFFSLINISLCGYTQFVNSFSDDRHLDCFHLGAIMKTTGYTNQGVDRFC